MPQRTQDGRGIQLPTVVDRLSGCSPEAFRKRCPRPVLLEVPPEHRLTSDPCLSPSTPRPERSTILKDRLRQLLRALDPTRASVHPFPGSPALIGGDPLCTLFVRHPGVSQRHARLERGEGRWELSDMESRSGTRVEDQRLAVGVPRPLWGGEVVALGGFQTLVLFPGQLYGLVRRRASLLSAKDAPITAPA